MERFIGDYDSDIADNIDTSKSTSGTMFFLGDCLVSWQSIKRKVVALSNCEAEYITTTTAATQALCCQCCLESSLAERLMWWS
jgi:hypothetical protein